MSNDFDVVKTSTTPFLYHYQPYKSEWMISLLLKNHIFFSPSTNFNDPWDCRAHYNDDFTEQSDELNKAVKYFVDIHRIHHSEITEEQRQIMAHKWRTDKNLVKNAMRELSKGISSSIEKQYKIYCLTPNPKHILMWAHYAANHSGICLEFSTNNEVFSSAFKVNYMKEHPKHEFITNDPRENLLPMISKALDWGYENEFRLIAEERSHAQSDETLKADDGYFTFPPAALKSIIIGYRMPQAQQNEIQELLKAANSNAKIKKATIVPGRYEIMIN